MMIFNLMKIYLAAAVNQMNQLQRNCLYRLEEIPGDQLATHM
jgi:hypothetical protein